MRGIIADDKSLFRSQSSSAYFAIGGIVAPSNSLSITDNNTSLRSSFNLG